jgi:hypothetical protein
VIEAVAKLSSWLPPGEAVAGVAHHLGCTPEAAELQIVGKGKAGLIRARGVIEDRPVSPLPAAWNGTIDLASATMRPPGASYEITNVTLRFGGLVAQRLLAAPALGRARWSAAEALAWIIMGVPLALEEWAGLFELGGGMEQAGKELARMIGEDWVPAWGRTGSLQGPMEQMPGSDLRIPGFTWVVRPHGLGTSPPGRLAVFLGAPRGPAEPERRCWYGIEVDAAALRQARPRLLTTSSPGQASSSPPTSPRKNVSEAELRNCILTIKTERPDDPPDEEELRTEVEKRLEATVSRDRIRQARDNIAPKWKLPPGRPRKSTQ